MRSLLALGLVIAVCTSAAAAHSKPRHHGYHSHGGSYGAPSPYDSYGSYGGSSGGGYGGFSGSYGGGFSGHNSSQWGGQPD